MALNVGVEALLTRDEVKDAISLHKTSTGVHDVDDKRLNGPFRLCDMLPKVRSSATSEEIANFFIATDELGPGIDKQWTRTMVLSEEV